MNTTARETSARGTSAVGATVARLGVLLTSGVPPIAAWGYLDDTAITRRVTSAVRTGMALPDAIYTAAEDELPVERDAWRGVAAAWAVATEAGAPLAPTLLSVASTLRDLAQAQREIAVALASPKSTARLVLGLPFVGMAFASLLGFNTVAVLYTTPPGWICLVLSGALPLGAARWNDRLVRRAQPREIAPGLDFDLVAIALSGGASLDRALSSVKGIAERYGLRAAMDDAEITGVLELSRRAGVPAAELLRGEATERRRGSLAATQTAVRELGVRLMIPLGVCVLPAFMIVSVVPLLLSLLMQSRF